MRKGASEKCFCPPAKHRKDVADPLLLNRRRECHSISHKCHLYLSVICHGGLISVNINKEFTKRTD